MWDIHAPRVPGEEELAQLIGLAADAVPVSRLWVNPDCGLKTRGYAETKASLENLVAATRQVRAERELNTDAARLSTGSPTRCPKWQASPQGLKTTS